MSCTHKYSFARLWTLIPIPVLKRCQNHSTIFQLYHCTLWIKYIFLRKEFSQVWDHHSSLALTFEIYHFLISSLVSPLLEANAPPTALLSWLKRMSQLMPYCILIFAWVCEIVKGFTLLLQVRGSMCTMSCDVQVKQVKWDRWRTWERSDGMRVKMDRRKGRQPRISPLVCRRSEKCPVWIGFWRIYIWLQELL